MAAHRFPLDQSDRRSLAVHLKFPVPIEDLCDAEIVELYAHEIVRDALGAQSGLDEHVVGALAGLHGDNVGPHLTDAEKARIREILDVTLDA